jgi:hypothetical protein
LKESAQVSGIALERLLTPAQNRLDGAQAYYNQQLVKFRQMGIAVAGFRANGGGWMNRTNQQAVFAPFGLKSYEQGLLDFQLERSVLITLNEKENEEILKLKADRAAVLRDGVDEKTYLLIAGYSEKEADEIIMRKDKERSEGMLNESNLSKQTLLERISSKAQMPQGFNVQEELRRMSVEAKDRFPEL